MLNKVILMGRLASEPELKTTEKGVSVTTFNLAVDRNYVNKNTGERDTDFLTIVAWRANAEFISRHFSKGSMICISGSVQTRKYEAKDGTKRTAVEFIADEVYFAGSSGKKSTDSANNSSQPQVQNNGNKVSGNEYAFQNASATNDDFVDMPMLGDDDLPF